MYNEEQRARDAMDDINRGSGKGVCDMKQTVKSSCKDGDARDLGAG